MINIEEQMLSPEEIQSTLVGFLGHTYGEISKYDKNIVAPNPFLAPKKQEFQNLAERVMSEVTQTYNKPKVQQHQTPPTAFIDTGIILPPAPNDPNQMEFSFDNSVTAITINKKLEDIDNKIKKLDNMMKKVLSLLDGYETKDS
jgi:hypothetical protein